LFHKKKTHSLLSLSHEISKPSTTRVEPYRTSKKRLRGITWNPYNYESLWKRKMMLSKPCGTFASCDINQCRSVREKRSALQNTRFKFWQYRTFFRHTHIHTESSSANAAQQFRDFLGGINDFCTIYFGTAIIAITRNGSTGLSRVDGISWNRSSSSPLRSRSCVS
jgi:hypothetical protein